MKSRYYLERNKLFFYTAFLIMTLVMIYPLFFTGIGCNDDLQNYLVARWGDIMRNAAESAAVAGRFYYILVKPVNILPYLIDNMYVVKLFQVIPLVICFILFARIIFVVSGSLELSFLFYLFFLVFSQVSGDTNLFVTYPFYFTFSFSLLLCSYLLLISYLEKKDKKALTWSTLFFAIGIIFYESYLLYLVVFGLTIFFYRQQRSGNLKQTLKTTCLPFIPYFAVVLAYLVAYLVYRSFHPSNYTGTAFDPGVINPGSFFSVLWSLSSSAFPLTVYESHREFFYTQSEHITGFSPVLLNLILQAKVEWLIKGILAAITGFLLLNRLPAIRGKIMVIVIGLSALLIFMPHIPLALTSKYTFYVSLGMSGYVTTFFSLFGVLLLMVFLAGYLVKAAALHKYLKLTLTLAISGVLFIISILTDFSNEMISKDIGRANLKFRAMEELSKTAVFSSIPKDATILGEELYDNPYHSAQNLISVPFNWTYYIDTKTGCWYDSIVGNKDKYAESWKRNPEKTYYFMVSQSRKSEEVALIVARISPPEDSNSVFKLIADSAWILYYSPYKIFSFGFSVIPESLRQGQYLPVRVGSFLDTLYTRQREECTIVNTVRGNPASFFTIHAESIDLRSIKISDLITPGAKEVFLYNQSRYGYKD